MKFLRQELLEDCKVWSPGPRSQFPNMVKIQPGISLTSSSKQEVSHVSSKPVVPIYR